MQTASCSREELELRLGETRPRIYQFFYYRMQNREEAEELTQETFRRVLPQLEAGKVDKAKLAAYISTAARNLLIDYWRRRSRQPLTASLQELQEKGWDFAGQQAAEVEEKLMVQQALNQLSVEYRLVLTYRIIEGWPVEEVARKMKRSPGAVRSLQFRAVRALKDTLEKGGYFHA